MVHMCLCAFTFYIEGTGIVILLAKSEHYYGKQGHFDTFSQSFTQQGSVRSSVYLLHVHR